MNKKELDDILNKHKIWLSNGKGARADLRGANLRGANLWDADLRGAKLWDADLRDADLQDADLQDADLRGAKLWDADLRGAKLWDADLRGADLQDADLRGAKLWDADLRGAKLRGAKNLSVPFNCPEEGEFIAFKKARNNLIVKLKVPKDARRLSATGRKCRCDKAEVLAIETIDGNPVDVAFSKYDETFKYEVGKTIEVKDFDVDRWNECSTGIHFFITRQEAVDW